MLDLKRMPMYAGYTLASVSMEKQTILYDFIKENHIEKISKKNVDALMTRPEVPWDMIFLRKAFGLEILEKKRGRKNVIIESAKIQPYLFEDELNKVQDTVVNTMNMRYQIRQKLKEYNIDYSEKEVLKAIDMYLKNK